MVKVFFHRNNDEVLETDIEELIDINEKKLRSRFDGGSFDAEKSQHKKPGDL